MPDISKLLGDGPQDAEVRARLAELDEWSEDIARRRAADVGIELTDEHLAVLHFLREYYLRHGPADHARDLAGRLEERFARSDSRRHLYELFPGGPVTQGSLLAGLPVPPGSTDPSFGSVR